ncbi:MAG: NAD(P)H-binding protein [Hyphomicrobium sp.]|uniref:NAD(P)H-binding protein n=1 Tax=Hyphomicrobium sp. TaxID=82 RepID=UPI0039E376FC
MRSALVLGATGGIGGAVAANFLRRGWDVKALARDPASARRRWQQDPSPIWLKGDAMSRADVIGAAQGVSVIAHAVNPPGYKDWDKFLLPMLDNTIEAAKTAGARIVLPGNVYNFGPDAFDSPDENAPQNPLTRKGKIRVEMERRLKEASDTGAKTLIVRAGDFFGPHAGGSWFSQGLIQPGKPVKVVRNPGKAGVGHQWAYLPDLAETMAVLLEREDRLADFAVFHFDGFWDADGQQMGEAIRIATGDPSIPIKPFPWWLIRLASPFVTTFRELIEMRYLWDVPLRISNKRLVSELGYEPRTNIVEAVRETLRGLKCLPAEGRF